MATSAFTKETNYVQQFPNTTFNNVTDAYSTYGAGKFFVALMEIAKNKVTAADPNLSLQKRRGDLWNLAITPDNAEKEVPYLKIVNGLLINYLDGASEEQQIWSGISDGSTSFVSYNHTAARIKALLTARKSSLHQVNAHFDATPYDTAWVNARMGLAASDVAVLGKTDLPSGVTTGVTPAELMQTAGIPTTEALEALVATSFVNFDNQLVYQTATPSDKSAVFKGTTQDHLLQIRRLLILTTATGWDYATADTILSTLFKPSQASKPIVIGEAQLKTLAQVIHIAEAWGITPDKAATIAMGFTQANLTTLTQENLDKVTPVATYLGVSLSLLLTYTQPQPAHGIDELFDLVQYKALAESAGTDLVTMASIVLSVQADTKIPASAFKAWYTDVSERVAALTTTYPTSTSASEKADLNQKIFQLWTHALSVFLGVADGTTHDFMAGVAEDNLATLNNNFIGAEKESSAEVLCNAAMPYLMSLDSLDLDKASLHLLGTTYSTQGAISTYTATTNRDLLMYTYVSTHPLASDRAAWIQFFKAGAFDKATFKAKLAPIFHQSGNDIESLYPAAAINTVVAAVKLAYHMIKCFEIASLTQLNISDLKNLASGTLPGDLESVADSNHLLEQDRDRLVPVVARQINQTYADIMTPDALSDYFLCDVETAGSVQIAPLREAMDAVQTYLMRCKNGVEHITYSTPITTEEWAWIPHFRIWQAEQKLINHTVDYLRPDMRSTTTELFKSFKNKLQQMDITAANVEEAFMSYLDDWDDLQNLEMVDGFGYELDGKNVITMIGKSPTERHTFYYASQTAQIVDNKITNPTWSEWIKIPVSIPVDTINGGFVFQKMMIFWVEQSQKTDQDSNEKYTIYTNTVKFIYQKLNGSWTSPKEIVSFPYYSSSEKSGTSSKYSNSLKMYSFSGKEYKVLNNICDSRFEAKEAESIFHQLWKRLRIKYYSSGDCSLIISASNFDVGKPMEVMENKHLRQINLGMMTEAYEIDLNKLMSAPYNQQDNQNKTFVFYNTFGSVSDSDNPWGFVQANYGGSGAFNISISGSDTVSDTDHLASAQGAFIQDKNQYGSISFFKDNDNVSLGYDSSRTNSGRDKVFVINNQGGAFYCSVSTAHFLAYTLDQSKQPDNNNKIQIVRMKSIVFQRIKSELLKKGLSGLFSEAMQETPSEHQNDDAFSRINNFSYYLNRNIITMPNIDSNFQVEFDGPMGIYARELFFHAPMLVASVLSKNLQFENAKNWYHYIFNPLNGKDKVWQYKPFKDYKTSPTSTPSDSFDPDIRAEHDLSLYMSWTVRQYIQNLIDWGDNEFRQETWESLSAATQMYLEAENLLGQMPETLDKVTQLTTGEQRTYTQYKPNDDSNFFATPTDTPLKSLWTTVQQRLFNLRHGLNINGEAETPSEYGSPIKPNLLLAAAQNGGINPGSISTLQAHLPHYRFREWLPVAQSMIETVVQFGNQLYSALQQFDGEKLQELQATHQVNLQNYLTQQYRDQIAAAQANLEALNLNLTNVKAQKEHYDTLIKTGLIKPEKAYLASNALAAEAQKDALILRGEATVAHLIPTIFGMSDGGFQPGSAIEAAASVLQEGGQVLQTQAQVFATQAEYKRRGDEWAFQRDTLANNINEINKNIAGATLQLKIAQDNMDQHLISVNQAREVHTYLSNKFTNADFYHWMSGKMASLYFTAYQMALSSLHKLQRAYQYELDNTDNFIPANSWDSLHKGLLAGETLKLAVARMHDSYMSNNERRLEIEKVFSLKDIANDKWPSFISGTSGEDTALAFDITESDLSKSSNQILKIKSVSVSIPAVLGPYQTFDATLTITTSNNNNGNTDTNKESIVISKGIDDMGIFPMDMNDGRYLPFEGRGAISSWEFKVDKGIAAKISDIIFTMRFTAK